MPNCREADISYFGFTIEYLKKELRDKLGINLIGFLQDDEDILRAYLEYAYTIGYTEGFADRSGARRVVRVNDKNQVIGEYRSVKQAAIRLGVAEGSIQDSIRHSTRKCKGYRFRFKQ